MWHGGTHVAAFYQVCIIIPKKYMKTIMEKLEESNPGRVADFKKNAQPAVKKVSNYYVLILTRCLV